MKRTFLLTSVAGVLSLLFSVDATAQSIAAEFRTFVDSVEATCKNFTEEQWKEANVTFDKLVDEYKAQKGSLTEEDRKGVSDAVGRYKALVMNSGFDSAKKAVVDSYNRVAQGTTEAYTEVKSFFNGVFKKKDK